MGAPDPTIGISRERDWPAQVADAVESIVGTIRDKTTLRAETIARAIVYGVVLGTVAVMALVLAVVALFRALYVLPLKVWAIDLIAGGLFCVVGAFIWRKRRPSSPA